MTTTTDILSFRRSIAAQAQEYITDKTKAAEGLVFAAMLKSYAKEVDDAIRSAAEDHVAANGGHVIHTLTNPETGEMREFDIRLMPARVSKSYDARTVLQVLGERAIPYLSVASTIKKGLADLSARGDITMAQVEAAQENATEKTAKGSLRVAEIKPKM